MDSLVERLRAKKCETDGYSVWDILRNPDGPEAAALIRRMADELRKAGEYVDIERLGRG